MKRKTTLGIVAEVVCWSIIAVLCLCYAPASERSPKWHAVRDAYYAEHTACEACGYKTKIEVHHVRPRHLWPERELDPTNLISLCDKCHWVIGHLGDERSYNPLVREDAARHLARVQARPYTKADAARFEREFKTP